MRYGLKDRWSWPAREHCLWCYRCQSNGKRMLGWCLRFTFLLAGRSTRKEMCHVVVLYGCARDRRQRQRPPVIAATSATSETESTYGAPKASLNTKSNEVKNVVLIEIELRLIAVLRIGQAQDKTNENKEKNQKWRPTSVNARARASVLSGTSSAQKAQEGEET